MQLIHTVGTSRQFLIQSHGSGSDPSKLVEELAKKRKKKVLGVSLGQGQDVIARKLMTQALAEGHWVLLQNAHLGLGYLTEVVTTSAINPCVCACSSIVYYKESQMDVKSRMVTGLENPIQF